MSRDLLALIAVFNLMFLALAGFAWYQDHEEGVLLDRLIADTLGPRKGPDTHMAVARALSRNIFKRVRGFGTVETVGWLPLIEDNSGLFLPSGTILKYGIIRMRDNLEGGACGSMTRVLLNALWRLGIPARKLNLLPDKHGKGGGHVMVEVLEGGRQLVISPSDNSFVWRREDGAIATVEEIRADPEIFAQIYWEKPHYKYRVAHTSNFRIEKFPPALRPLVVWAMERLVSPDPRQWQLPHVYDQPYRLLLWVALAGFMLTAPASYRWLRGGGRR